MIPLRSKFQQRATGQFPDHRLQVIKIRPEAAMDARQFDCFSRRILDHHESFHLGRMLPEPAQQIVS
jgi:hypothetical protein